MTGLQAYTFGGLAICLLGVIGMVLNIIGRHMQRKEHDRRSTTPD